MPRKKTKKNLTELTIEDLPNERLADFLLYSDRHAVIDQHKKTGKLTVAVNNPEDAQVLDYLRHTSQQEPKIVPSDRASVEHLKQLYHEKLDHEIKNLSGSPLQADSYTGHRELHNLVEHDTIKNILRSIIRLAIHKQASDIHFEPNEQFLLVRFRIDGILHDFTSLPLSLHLPLLARLKYLSKLPLRSNDVPDRGNLHLHYDGSKHHAVVVVMPTNNGEKAIVKLTPHSRHLLTLEQLGMSHQSSLQLNATLKKTHGMVVVAGPFGSGVTSTLYALIQQMNNSAVNITSIEDPIEYPLPRINQVEVTSEPGLSAESLLNCALQQDSDIIMLGRLPDNKTAELATHAAMTGHLILVSVPASDAIAALIQMSNLGIPPYQLAATTNVVIAQRLVRKICLHCRTSFRLSKKQLKEITVQIPEDALTGLFSHLNEMREGQTVSDLFFYKAVGCPHCNYSGYLGQTAIFEFLEMRLPLIDALSEGASADQLQQIALRSGMQPLLHDGMLKAKHGITTLDE
ncbi:GspE/PulE family protein, partial [Patescibacteria group bacterium]